METSDPSADLPEVDVHLFADYVDRLRRELSASSFVNGAHSDDRVVVTRFCDMVRRRVPLRPRSIVLADGLSYPAGRDQADLEVRLQRLLEKARAGEDLNPHLSLKTVDLERHDPLFNDWGIRHFHLHFAIRHDGFVQRSGPLLYARVTDDRLYALGVFEHGDDQNHQFEDRDLLRIEHDNWPDVIAQWRMPESVRPLYDYGDELRRGFRQAGIVTTVQLGDDVTYLTPGGGYASNGDPAGCTLEAVNANNALVRADLFYREHAAELVAVAERSGLALGKPIRLTLVLNGTHAFAVEHESQGAFPIYDLADTPGFQSFVQHIAETVT